MAEARRSSSAVPVVAADMSVRLPLNACTPLAVLPSRPSNPPFFALPAFLLEGDGGGRMLAGGGGRADVGGAGQDAFRPDATGVDG